MLSLVNTPENWAFSIVATVVSTGLLKHTLISPEDVDCVAKATTAEYALSGPSDDNAWT